MANLTYDVRRTDLRTNVYETPYWISSGSFTGAQVGTIALFSFPVADQIIWFHQVVCQIIGVFDAGTIDVGTGSLATDAATAGDVLTTTDADEFIKQGDITVTTAGFYGSTSGANTSDWRTGLAAMSYAAPMFLVGAAATTPIVFATVGGSASGTARVHMLISRIPGK